MQLSLGFSTCPNDTFMFDALVNQRINTEEFTFETKMADIRELNELAADCALDITKVSYHAYAYLRDKYVLLDSGSALGHGCGPLLISNTPLHPNEVLGKRIAIPGKNTTANLLFSLAYPDVSSKEVYLFHEIENAVLNGEVDLGLIIHENRFTYKEKGLHKVLDLGNHWESNYNLPIPLGGIIAKRSIGQENISRISNMLAKSVQFAFDNPKESQNFVLAHAQEMEQNVVQQHIELYVNQYSVSLGETGKAAVQKLYQVGSEKGLFSISDKPIFVSQI